MNSHSDNGSEYFENNSQSDFEFDPSGETSSHILLHPKKVIPIEYQVKKKMTYK